MSPYIISSPSRLALALIVGSTFGHAIRFNISTPMQCEPLQVTWEDKSGDGDMRLLIMPVGFQHSCGRTIRNDVLTSFSHDRL